MSPTTRQAPHAIRPASGMAREYQFPAHERITLENGITVLVASVRRLPVVSVLARIDAGAMSDPAGRDGVALLTGHALAEGTTSLDGADLADRFERLGAALEPDADWDHASLGTTVLAIRLPAAVRLIADVLRRPAFPDREIDRLRGERQAELLQQQAEPRGLADEMFARFIYASSSRFSRPDGGTPESVAALTSAAVRDFHDARYRPPGVTLTFAGDIGVEEAVALAREAFGEWEGASAPPPVLDAAPARLTRAVHLVAKADAPQSELRVGHVGLPRAHPDFFPTSVMNAILGGLFNSRINLNLREAHAYTYGASSGFAWHRAAGPFAVSSAVRSDVTTDALREILGELERMQETSVSEEELSLATSYLAGVFPIRFETTAAIASALANLALFKLPHDFFDTYRARIREVGISDVQRVAQMHLHREALQIVVVGDPAITVEPLQKLDAGPVQTYDAEGLVIAP